MVHLPFPSKVQVMVPSYSNSADHVPARASLLPQAERVRIVTAINNKAANFFIATSFF